MAYIWIFTAKGSPQHIGNANKGETCEQLVKAAQDAGHSSARVCLQYTAAGKLRVDMFDSLSTLNQYMDRNKIDGRPYDLWYLTGMAA